MKKIRGARAAHPEPRLPDAGPPRRSPRPPVGRRRIQRRCRRGGRGQPDDRARGEGPRVPRGVRREPRARRRAGLGRPIQRRRRTPTRGRGGGGRLPSRVRRGRSPRASARRPSGCCTWRSRERGTALYLASATERGAFKPKKGSLGEVLPESLRGVFGAAAAMTGDGAEVLWTAGTGATHTFRICASTAAPERDVPAPFSVAHDGQEGEPAAPADDFGAIADRAGRGTTSDHKRRYGRAALEW